MLLSESNYINRFRNKKKYPIVRNSRDIQYALRYINSYDYLSFDTETTGLNVRKDKVIGFSFSGKSGTAIYYPLYFWNKVKEELIPIEDNIKQCKNILYKLKDKELLMWNGSFDIRMIKNNFNIDLTDSLVADGMLLKHTVEEEGDFALKKVGVQIQDKIGFDVEESANQEQIELKENVKANGGSTTKSNFEMYKADLDVLGKYAAADADLTLRICEYYSDLLEKEGLLDFFYEEEVMPLYKEVTIPMEERGVKLDIDLLESSRKEIIKDIGNLENKVIRALEDTDDFYDWYTHVVEIFTDEVPRGKYAQGVVEYFNLPLPKTATGKYRTSKKELMKLPNSEAKEFLLGNVTQLNMEDQFAIKEKIYLEKNKKKINISSKKQMGEVVFDYMGIMPLSKTEKGAPQFNDTMIEWLADNGYEWAKDLRDYNKLIKIKGTYIDRFLDNHEDGYYYFSYKQHGTISGRYGSDAQQLPRPMEPGEASEVVRKHNNRIRSYIKARDGYKFIIADQSSLEPRVFASVSGDPNLIKVFLENEDLYSRVAIQAFKLKNFSAKKTDDNFLKKIYPELRQRAKAIALAIPYGAREFQIARTLGISMEEAKELMDSYLEGFPKLARWMKWSKSFVQANGYITTKAGRVRHLPRAKEIYEVYGDKLMNFKFRKKLEKSHERDYVLKLYRDYKNSVNNSRNVQIQGLAASIMNRSGVAISREFNKKGIDGHIVMQVHDEYVVEVLDSQVKTGANIVKDKMENTLKIDVPLIVEPNIAGHFGEGHE